MANKAAHQSDLRKGRISRKAFAYFITTSTKDRLALFANAGLPEIVLECLRRLNAQDRIELIAAVVMPDRMHFVARLRNSTLAGVLHSLKSFSSQCI